MDDYCSSSHISQAAVSFVYRHSYRANAVTELRIDHAQEIPCYRFKHVDRPPTVGDDPDMGLTLSRGLPIPKHLKNGEVTPIQTEHQEDNQSSHPLSRVGPITPQVWRDKFYEK